MPPELWSLYELMLKSRLFEEAVTSLWQDGLITGEMHLGTGEEAIVAGIVSQLQDGDSMVLDHRGTAPMLMRGVDPALILRELLGYPDGLCGGMGGHMHLFSREHQAASSGIVGAAGPAAAGFALTAQCLRSGAISVAFFGEGAMNQGMLMESMNLAAAWKLPVLFVCKDDSWAITTRSNGVTGGDLNERARGLGLQVMEVDGTDAVATWEAARRAIERLRSGAGAVFLHARCVHFEGHFLGLQLISIVRDPLRELPKIAIPLTKSFLNPRGASLRQRLAGLQDILTTVLLTWRDPRRNLANDPVRQTRRTLLPDAVRLQELEERVEKDIIRVFESVLTEAAS
jgi:acetoin:2,6-dichlorophenolindophenol oxidoreductase subunit alpha